MNKAVITVIIAFIVIAVTQTTSSKESIKTTNLSEMQVTKSLASMPLSFTENRGQWDDKIMFRGDAGRATMWFASDGVSYHFSRKIESEDFAPISDMSGRQTPSSAPNDMRDRQSDSYESLTIKANFVGANVNPQMVGLDMIDYKCNYFIGNDQSKWATDVPNYTAVMYEEIYDGIDLKYYGNGTHMEYDFIVSPGVDYSQIKIQYEGAESIAVNENGELVVTTKWGEVVEQRPVIYQIENNSRIPIDGKYLLQSNNSFGFDVSNYNSEIPLVIDPVLEYSTYLGGSGNDIGFDIAVDAMGAAYITGYTQPSDFPILNPFTGTYQGGTFDVYVSKLNPFGNGLSYSTYLGGSDDDRAFGIVVDASGSAYVTGRTLSPDFPMSTPYQGTLLGSEDAFVTKLSPAGNSLIYSTYLGGSVGAGGTGADQGRSIAIDASGSAYVTGVVTSTDFPTVNSFQATRPAIISVFLTKFNSTGTSLIYSTYFGGTPNTFPEDIAVDASGSAYITGNTASPDLPLKNPYQNTLLGGWDAFVTKFNSNGDSLIYSTFLGGSSSGDGAYGIAVDISGSAYITGRTSSTDFPTVNPYQSTHGGFYDVYVTKFSPAGNSLVYSTFLGGNSLDEGHAIAVNTLGEAYVTGMASINFPLSNPYSSTYQGGNSDVFVTRISSTGDNLLYSTYIGGGSSDQGRGIAVDLSEAAFVTGLGFDDFPVYNPFQSVHKGGGDAFILKIGNESDFDNDWIADGSDNCEFISNQDQLDSDNDLVGDSCDNCPNVPNQDQLDLNQNGIGDACEGCCVGIRGNIDSDANDSIDIADLVYLVAFMFQNGPAPACLEEADIDGSGGIDIADLVSLVAYMFQNGPAPNNCP